MSIQRISTSFLPLTPQWKYDVFLSFRSNDTRKAFTDNLYAASEHQGIITFRVSGMILNFRKGRLFLQNFLLQLKNQDLLSLFFHKIMHHQHGAWMTL
ncbi:putative TIR domain-containing protein [Rosa chinensis]|uniref:Putative TIR domain-containing protein n=1 Tax=Rosa chinensis TaxID=74649 RepID=A0A2P6PJK5_ROSCH|nr:putative TIR domain-containing protein [Rosa chinensis]